MPEDSQGAFVHWGDVKNVIKLELVRTVVAPG